MNTTLTKTFHTREEAEFYASTMEQEIHKITVKSREFHTLSQEDDVISEYQKIELLNQLMSKPEPREIFSRFSQVIRKWLFAIIEAKR